MSTYLDGLHIYADDTGRQVHAAHFCIHLEHDLHQCGIFDRNAHDARLIGIEYIISEDRFRSLLEEEKKLWHSHHYEIKSGILTDPGVPEIAEHAYFKDLVKTYGKTFHTWQYNVHDFPYGAPQLMMGFTEDGKSAKSWLESATAKSGSRRSVTAKAAKTSRCRRWPRPRTRGRAEARCRRPCRKYPSIGRTGTRRRP